jgi:hypothetical protein
MTATTTAEAKAIETLELEPVDTARSVPAVQQANAVALADNSPASMMLKAMSQGASLEQVEKMMDLQDRWERREAEKAANEALSAFKAEFVEILKRKRVSFTTRDGETTSYKHAELSDVVDAVGPALARHGFSYRWDVKQDKNEVTVTCILKHSKGHSESVTMSAPPDASGKKNSIQQIASAVSYLQRYTLKAITGVAEKGQDDDGAGAGGGDPYADLLDSFRAAAMEGTAALRKRYESDPPPDEFWSQHARPLKAAARKADEAEQ